MNCPSHLTLTAQKVSKTFTLRDGKHFNVLEDLDVDLPRGAVVGILGASGCGKTTFLRIAAGLETSSSGTLYSDFPRPGPKVGYLQQSERLLPWRTVVDNVALGLELTGAGPKAARQEALQVLSEVGMSEFATLYPWQLSGGMAQRVLLGRTLAPRPALLLLDEPLGQLDILGRQALASYIKDYIRRENSSALLVTHSVEEAIFISDIILTLSRRPAKVVGRFVLNPDFSAPTLTHLPHESSFERVQQSLLEALGSTTPEVAA